jgi:1-acyl-sn-glycerol-3-phosphate acyltransferase
MPTKTKQRFEPAAAKDRDRIARELLETVRALALELKSVPGETRVSLDSSLQRELGIDSLGLAELLLRLERRFQVHLPETLLGEAETPRDLLRAIENMGERAARAIATRPTLAPLKEAADAPHAATSLTEALDWHADHHSDRPHILLSDGFAETGITYGALQEQARMVARGLRERGLMPGDRVAIMLPTGAAFFQAFFGSLYAGGVPVPIYPPMRLSQLEDHLRRQAGILRNAGATFLLAPPEGRALSALLKAQVETLRAVAHVDDIRSDTPAPLPSGAEATDLAMLQYTSGSTGDPKGVMLTHGNLLNNIRAMGGAIEASSKDIFVSWLPLYHDLGLIGAWLGSLYFAAPVVIMSPLTFIVRPEAWLWAIHRNRATLSAAPNFGFELCVKKIDESVLAGLDLSSLRLVANGAEPISSHTIRRFEERFAPYGFPAEAMAPVYGLAENSVGLAFPPLGRTPVVDRVQRVALTARGAAAPAEPGYSHAVEQVACGRPLPGHEIRIVDAMGRELSDRQEGRIEFRGPSATQGYFRNEEKTRALFDGAWLDTGDLGYIAAGDLFITGRIKDVIIKAGRNIYPEEIEETVGDLEGVRKGCVAVFASAEPATGTEKLVILAETYETEPDSKSEIAQRIIEAASDLLETPPDDVVLAVPHTVPKTSSGKIRRAAARSFYEAGDLKPRIRAVWLQVLRLALAGVAPRFRASGRVLADLIYAGWWWSIVVVLAMIAWPVILLLPGRALRWRFFRRLARLAFKLIGTPITVEGAERLPERSGVLVTNHASYLDGLALAAVLPGTPVFVAKRELSTQIVAGPFLKRLGAFFTERAEPKAGLEEVEQLAALTRSGAQPVFFAEGTFTRMPGLLEFRLGAFTVAVEAGVAVTPIAINGSRSILRGGQWLPRKGRLSIHVGDALMPQGGGFKAAVALRDAARASVLAHCGEPDLARERVIFTKEGIEQVRAQ